jgi:hypothetical protein
MFYSLSVFSVHAKILGVYRDYFVYIKPLYNRRVLLVRLKILAEVGSRLNTFGVFSDKYKTLLAYPRSSQKEQIIH